MNELPMSGSFGSSPKYQPRGCSLGASRRGDPRPAKFEFPGDLLDAHRSWGRFQRFGGISAPRYYDHSPMAGRRGGRLGVAPLEATHTGATPIGAWPGPRSTDRMAACANLRSSRRPRLGTSGSWTGSG